MTSLFDLIKAKLAYFSGINENEITNERIIADLIRGHKTMHMSEGISYYNNKNVGISRKERFYFEDGTKITDNTKTNTRLSHNWHKLLVDQKVGYLLSKPMTIKADDDDYNNMLDKLLGNKFDDIMIELGKNASNKGVEYLHPYIDDLGSFKYCIIPAEEIIPIYDTETNSEIVAVIRHYTVNHNGKKVIRAEYWDDQTVTFYIQGSNGEFSLDFGPASHFDLNGICLGWRKVPFVEFRNNEEKISDLQFYKSLIDDYDFKTSELADNLDELQSAILVLKNYDGTNLKEFMEGLRYYKAVKVFGKDGGVDKLNNEIPVNTLDSHLNRLQEDIFIAGQGINVKNDKFGSNPSGVALKFLYQPLDFKCSMMERKFEAAIQELIWFVTEYIAIRYNVAYDFETVTIVFNKTIISNQKENVEMAVQSVGIISNETIIANHPWVINVQDEIKRLEQEKVVLQSVQAVKPEDNTI